MLVRHQHIKGQKDYFKLFGDVSTPAIVYYS